MSSSYAISTHALEKDFVEGGTTHKVLRGIDFQVPTGEFCYLVGPSGSGKTTLLSIVGCVLTATRGEVSLLGNDVTKMKQSDLPRLRLSSVGFIFQGHNLLASMSATENVAMPLWMRGMTTTQATAAAVAMLDKVGLSAHASKRPNQLSGGQRQRVAIARALAGNPPILLADEPTASLDAQSGKTTVELMKALTREMNTTCVVVTHDSRIYSYADRIVGIEDGQLTSHVS
jgi:putative ABC transport system ATP-binding protein